MWSVIRAETAEFEQRKDGRKIIMTFSMKRALTIFQKDYKDRHGSLAHRHASVFLLLVLTDVIGVRRPVRHHRFARVLAEHRLDRPRASNRGRCWTRLYMGGTFDSVCLSARRVRRKYCYVSPETDGLIYII